MTLFQDRSINLLVPSHPFQLLLPADALDMIQSSHISSCSQPPLHLPLGICPASAEQSSSASSAFVIAAVCIHDRPAREAGLGLNAGEREDAERGTRGGSSVGASAE